MLSLINPLQGKWSKTITSSKKWILFKELKVQIRTYELRGHGERKEKKSTMGSHTTPWKKTISKTGLAL